MSTASAALPQAQQDALARAVRLSWWQIGWTVTIVVVMGLAMGGSQAMKTAWVEDMLGFVPPIAFLIAARLERRPPSAAFPFGFARVNGLGFFVSAVALAAVGVLLLWDAAATLIAREHATVGSVQLFGRDLWMGWVMIAAQAYALVPPLIIGRKLLPLGRTLNDKLLHTNALMNKANWLTGAAGLGGVVGLGMGWWWADAAAAAIISLDIIHDGFTALRAATAELVDGAPRELAGAELSDDANALHAALDRHFPGSTVRLRETGRLIRAEVIGARPPAEPIDLDALWPGKPDSAWRLDQLSFTPPDARRDD